MTKTTIPRRQFHRHAGVAVASVAASSFAPLFAAAEQRRFKIGACDWSIRKLADPDALEVARSIGLEGVQVSLGTAADDMHLRQPEVQDRYRKACRGTGLEIASLAIGELNNVPYKNDPRTIEWVSDCVDVLSQLGVSVALLAFFGAGDLKGDKRGTDEVVRRLREVAPKAEKAKVVLGLECLLSAEECADVVQRVGSDAVKVYYDVANSEKMGYDIYHEIRWLGRQNLICEFHAKENASLLGQGRIDFRKVREAIDDIGYSGWIQIEGSVPAGAAMQPSYEANLRYLRSMFPSAG